MIIKGKVWKFGHDVNTDEIIPARRLNTSDPKLLAKYCMEDADVDFTKKIKPGDIIIAGKNFGCGSSREHAPISIKFAGISAVIATSFARIFYRNSLNIGLPILESSIVFKKIKHGDRIEIDLNKGIIKNLRDNKVYKTTPFPPFMQELITSGGLMSWIKSKNQLPHRK